MTVTVLNPNELAHVAVVKDAVVQRELAALRPQEVMPPEFRQHLNRITAVMAPIARRKLLMQAPEVVALQEPGKESVDSTRIALVPILRAGWGMLQPCWDFDPHARVGIIDADRNEETLQPKITTCKLGPGLLEPTIVIDPMLATGGTASACIRQIYDAKAPAVVLLTLLCAPEGIRKVLKDHPDVHIVTAAIDHGLDERGYIVPGLGDAGDRMFGTL